MRVRNQCAPFAAALLCIVLAAGRAEAQGDAVAMVNGEPVGAAEFYDRVQRINVRDFIVTATPLTFRQNSAGQLVLDQIVGHGGAEVEGEQRLERTDEAHLLTEPPRRRIDRALAGKRMAATGVGPQQAGMVLGRIY